MSVFYVIEHSERVQVLFTATEAATHTRVVHQTALVNISFHESLFDQPLPLPPNGLAILQGVGDVLKPHAAARQEALDGRQVHVPGLVQVVCDVHS